MKTASPVLYNLIHSLSKSEKRYIQLHSTTEDSDYMQLWKILLKEESYDEAKLKVAFADAHFMKNFAMSKQYLFEKILLLLDRFRQKEEEDILIEKGRLVKVLWQKGFRKQAQKRLQKALKKAEKAELYEVQLFLLEIKKTFPEADFKETIEEVKNCLQKLQNINEYWEISQAIYHKQVELQKSKNYLKEEELYALFNTPKLFNVSFAETFRSQVYYYHARTTYFFSTGEKELAYKGNLTFLKLLEDNPKQLKMMPERYLSILNNLLIDSLTLEKSEEFLIGLKKLRNLPTQSEFKTIKDIKARIFKQGMSLEINYLLSRKDYVKAATLIEPLEKGLTEFEGKISSSHFSELEYLITYLLFLNKEYLKTLDWTNRILQKENSREIFQFTLILNLLAHFSLKNIELTKPLLVSVERRLTSKRELYTIENQLFKFLKSYLNAATWHTQKDLISNFKAEIISIKFDASQKHFFDFIDLEKWLQDFEKI